MENSAKVDEIGHWPDMNDVLARSSQHEEVLLPRAELEFIIPCPTHPFLQVVFDRFDTQVPKARSHVSYRNKIHFPRFFGIDRKVICISSIISLNLLRTRYATIPRVELYRPVAWPSGLALDAPELPVRILDDQIIALHTEGGEDGVSALHKTVNDKSLSPLTNL